MIAYIDQFKVHFSVELICRTLGNTPGGFLTSRGYWAAKIRPKSVRVIKDEQLGNELVRLFRENDSCLGVEKMHEIMKESGWIIGREGKTFTADQ